MMSRDRSKKGDFRVLKPNRDLAVWLKIWLWGLVNSEKVEFTGREDWVRDVQPDRKSGV